MANALYDIVKKNPKGEVHDFALAVLDAANTEYDLGMDIVEKKADNNDTVVAKKTPYKHEPASEHLVMIVCNTKTVRVDPLKIRIADFNKNQYGVRTFDVRSIQLDNERTIISIATFKDFTAAYDYVMSMTQTDYVLGGINKSECSIFPISRNNYPLYYQSKDTKEYEEFYDKINKK